MVWKEWACETRRRAALDATESRTPFRTGRGGDGVGSILCEATQLRQAGPRWFDAQAWGERAQPVGDGGRGGAWYIDATHGPCVLRNYLRGGMAEKVSRDRYVWRSEERRVGTGGVRTCSSWW